MMMYIDYFLGFENSWYTIAIEVGLIISFIMYAIKVNKKEYPISPCPRTWKPKPLVPDITLDEQPPLMGKLDQNVLNVGATSFLGFHKMRQVMEAATKTLRKYGVGSCGPRGFYGTIDVHLELEERLAKFLEVEETCVYSYGFSTIASAIPSYAKRGAVIFADEKVCFAIQKGIDASRSAVHYYKHNDVEHLEELIRNAVDKKQLHPKKRAFLIAEAIYFNTGEMCPLKKLVELARKYKLRIILDESLTIGVLGKNGRGITEHLGVPRDQIDLIVGSLEHSFATIGGFCAGTHFIVEHQRLSGLGYCFSASLPPMLTQAGISALSILEETPSLLTELEESTKKLHAALLTLKHYKLRGEVISPIKHIYLKREDLTDRLKQSYLRDISNYCLKQGVAVAVSAYIRDMEVNCPEPSIRMASSRKLNDENIGLVCRLLDEAYERVGPKPDLRPVL